MKHQTICNEDPDVIAAVADHRDTVREIRQRSSALITLKPGSPQREAAEAAVAELVSLVQVRAERLGMSTNDLLLRINQDIDDRQLGSGGAVLRVVRGQVRAAVNEEREAHEALTAAQDRVARATNARLSAVQLAAANGILVRG